MEKDQNRLGLSLDAAIVLALAETAIPFAASAEDQAERWVRVLRLHGHVGATLQALGVGEAPLETAAQPPAARAAERELPGAAVVEEVASNARRFAHARGARTVGTVDVLFAVLEVYGKTFDRALYVRGTTRDELLERLASQAGTSFLPVSPH
ncbi:MAG: hypothetical protein NVSMB25_05480 [Thermoleophilaceae bacterium]